MRPIRYDVMAFPGQQKFMHVQAKYSGFSGPVGTGKTFALANRTFMACAQNPGRQGLIGAPTYPMLRDVTIRTFLELLEERRVPFTFHKSEHSLFLKRSGAKIIFRPLEDYERLRGSNLAWFGIDELTYCQEGAWQRLEARLRDPKAQRLQAFAVWTPKGFDWVYRRFIGPERLPNHEVILAGPNENMAILSKNPSFYEDLKASYDERFYEQEALGAYLDVYSGRVYHAYDRAKHDQEQQFSTRIAEGVCWGIDFNIDPMATLLGQVRNGRVHIIDEIMLPVATTDAMCARVVERIDPWLRAWQDAHGSSTPLPICLYGDAAGNARSTKSSKSDYDLIKEFFRSKPAYKLRDYVPVKNPEVKDRVNSVNALLCNASGAIRVFIDPRCKALRRDLIEVTWKKESLGFELDKKKDSKLTHVSDAFGYIIHEVAPVNAFTRQHMTT